MPRDLPDAQGNMLTIKYLFGLSTYKNIAVPLALDFVWQVNTDPQVCMLVWRLVTLKLTNNKKVKKTIKN